MQIKKYILIAIFSFLSLSISAPLSIAVKLSKEEVDPEDSRHLPPLSTEQTSLLNQSSSSSRELVERKQDTRAYLNNRLGDLNKLFQTALVIYPPDFDPGERDQLLQVGFKSKERDKFKHLGYHILSHFDETFFDLTQTPRQPLCYLPLWMLEGVQGITGLIGSGVVSLTMTQYTNGILEPIFKWQAGGAIAWSVLGVSIVVHGPVAVVLFYEGSKALLQKKKSNFQPAAREGNDPYARVLPKPVSYRLLQGLVFASATTCGMIPTIAWFAFDEPLPFQIIIPPCVLYYFAFPYVRIGLEVLHDWHAEAFLTKTHVTRENRRALVAGLSDIEGAICSDNVGKLTTAIWDLLANRTGRFGKNSNNKVNKDQLVSALSALLSKGYNFDMEENEPNRHPYTIHYNRTTATNRIEEPFLREQGSRFAAHLFTGAALATGFLSESILLKSTLENFGAPPIIANAITYPVTTFAQTRGIFEAEIHRRNLERFPLPVSGEEDFSYIRAALTAPTALMYGTLGGLLFFGITYTQLEDYPSPGREILAALQGLRYFSIFFYIGSREYNNVFTSFKMRNSTNPSVSDQKSQILYFVREAKRVIMYDLDDETIAELVRIIWNMG